MGKNIYIYIYTLHQYM